MKKFSKSTTLRLNSHLEKLKNSIDVYKLNSSELTNKNFYEPKIIIENRKAAKNLLIKSVFLNLKILSYTRSSFLIRLLLKTEKVFVDKKFGENSDLSIKLFKFESRLKNLKDSLNLLKLIIINLLQIIANGINKVEKLLILIERKVDYCLNYCGHLLTKYINKYTKRWYVYLSRFFIVTLLNIIPFIQISTKLVYTYPNPHIANPLTNHLFDIFPVLLWVIGTTRKYVTNEALSFLLLGVYYQVFMFEPKLFRIPTKIAYQGNFSLAVMLLYQSVGIVHEIVTTLYVFVPGFFGFNELQNINLVKNYMKFFAKDLNRFKNVRDRVLGESSVTMDSVYKIVKITDTFTIFPFLSVIALLYNYVYFIIRGEMPFMPIVTKTVRRMVTDRKADEF